VNGRPIDLILSKLQARQTATGWQAKCPSHDGKGSTSLSITDGDGDRVLLHCFAGCTTEQVVASIGLDMMDLFPSRPNGRAHTMVMSWEIRGVDGALVAIHHRIDLPGGDKKVWWSRPGEKDNGLKGLRTAELPLYRSERIPHMASDACVFLVEGEKAADALAGLGFEALGTVTGAQGCPSETVLASLGDLPVYLWPDNDDVGREHMARIAAVLGRIGAAAPMWINWQEAPDKGDAADLVSAHDHESASELVRGLITNATVPPEITSPVADVEVEPDAPMWEPMVHITEDERQRAARDTFIDRYIAYATRRTDAPKSFHEAVALAILSVVVGRRAVLSLSVGSVYVSLWIMILADSTIFRKSTSMDYGQDIIESVDIDLLAPNDFTPQRFVAILSEHDGKPLLFKRDEFSGFYDGLNRLDYMAGLKDDLCNVYDSRPFRREKMKPRKRAGEDEPDPKEWKYDIREPFLSKLVGTTEERFNDVARVNDVRTGYLPRFAFVLPSDEQRISRPIASLDSTTAIQRMDLVAELRATKDRPITLTASQSAFQRFNQYVADIEREAFSAPNRDTINIIGSRVSWMALRVAMLLAVADASDRVEVPHILRAIEIAECWRHNGIAVLSGLAPSRFERRATRFVQVVMAKGEQGISRRETMRAIRANKREMDDLEATLRERGEIRVEWKQTSGGRSAWYFGPLSTLSRLSQGVVPVDSAPNRENTPGDNVDTRDNVVPEPVEPETIALERCSFCGLEAAILNATTAGRLCDSCKETLEEER